MELIVQYFAQCPKPEESKSKVSGIISEVNFVRRWIINHHCSQYIILSCNKKDTKLGRGCEISTKSEGKVGRPLKYLEIKCCLGGWQNSEPSAYRFDGIFSNLRKRKWCPCGTQLSREEMVIPISIEFYILPEKPQKDYSWIFKIAVHVEGGDEKIFLREVDKMCAVLVFLSLPFTWKYIIHFILHSPFSHTIMHVLKANT